MKTIPLARVRAPFTVFVFLAEVAHLAWEQLNGGVLSHNILNNPDLPAISNWWGLLVLPVLTWVLTGFIERRIANTSAAAGLPISVMVGFVAALLVGVLFAVLFRAGYEDVLFYLLMGLIALGAMTPLYRAEYGLGFVIGMTFTFGAVLPMLVSAVLMAMSAAFHLFWRLLRHLTQVFKRRRERRRE